MNAEHTCPICAASNDCDVARGKGTCWCFNAPVAAEMVDFAHELGVEHRCLCATCAAGDVPSPCIRTCAVDPDSQSCTGCLRTLAEIASWSALGPVARARILMRCRTAAEPSDRGGT